MMTVPSPVVEVCGRMQIGALVGGFALFILACVLGSRDFYGMAGFFGVISGGFFGAALMAGMIAKRFR